MALSTLEGVEIRNEIRTILTAGGAEKVRAVMIAAGVAGNAAKTTDVLAEFSTMLIALFGTTAPTVLP